MIVQKINGVCSMLMVSDNPPTDVTRNAFINLLFDAIVKHNADIDSAIKRNEPSVNGYQKINPLNIKEVLMVTNKSFFSYWFMKNGFSYNGDCNRRAKVKHMHFPKTLKREFSKTLGKTVFGVE